MTANPRKALTANEVARRLGVSVKDIYRLIREGMLKGYKAKYCVQVDAKSVEHYLNTLVASKMAEPCGSSLQNAIVRRAAVTGVVQTPRSWAVMASHAPPPEPTSGTRTRSRIASSASQ
jgi:excisionase family DNA binding protein